MNFTYITRIFGDVPKLVRGGSAKALFISSSLIVASWRLPLKRGSLFFCHKDFRDILRYFFDDVVFFMIVVE